MSHPLDPLAHFALNDHQAMGKITRKCVFLPLSFLPSLSPSLSPSSVTLLPPSVWACLQHHPASSPATGLLSECSHTSQKVQEHIESLQRELLN